MATCFVRKYLTDRRLACRCIRRVTICYECFLRAFLSAILYIVKQNFDEGHYFFSGFVSIRQEGFCISFCLFPQISMTILFCQSNPVKNE